MYMLGGPRPVNESEFYLKNCGTTLTYLMSMHLLGHVTIGNLEVKVLHRADKP